MKALLLAGLSLAAAAAPSIPAADKAAGARADVALRRAFGGRYDGAQPHYVAEVTARVAAQSGVAGGGEAFTGTLLDSPVENAFALPGGYVYVTRQLLALMNSEAQLASVMGHEVGHVVARHEAGRRRAATVARLLGRLVAALAGDDAAGALVGLVARTAGTLYPLQYARDQEFAADGLGVRYMTTAGYSPFAAATMLAQLDASATLAARLAGRDVDAVPAWSATHPNGRERVRRAARLATETRGSAAPAGQDVAFLRRLDGLRYDEAPADGVVEGQTFRHPGLRVRLTAPQGYKLTRFGRAVHVAGSGGVARFARTIQTKDPMVALAARLKSIGLNGSAAATRGVAAGLPFAAVTVPARADGRALDLTILAYRLSATTVRLDIVTPRGTGAGAFRPLIDSVAPMTAAEAAAVPGRRLRIVTVAPGDTIETLAARMAYPSFRRERFLALNGLPADATLVPGMLVKVVVAG